MIKISNWDPEIHSDVEQVQRIMAARDKKVQNGIVEKNLESSSPEMRVQGSGSEPYVVTLDSCDCSDFTHRKLPCKHIYALAFEIGLMNDLPKYKKEKALDYKSEIEKYKDLYLSGSIKEDTYVTIGKALLKA